MDETTEQRFTAEETKKRLRDVLRGAFAGPPTPLKDIPTRKGESRRSQRVKKKSSVKKPRKRA